MTRPLCEKPRCNAKLVGGATCQRPAVIEADGKMWCVQHAPQAKAVRAFWRDRRKPAGQAALLALALALLTALPERAWSHSFYSAQCCRGNDEGGDCGPVPDTDVKITPDGYLFLPTGETVPYTKALLSPDDRYHACIYPKGHVRCFYGKGGAS